MFPATLQQQKHREMEFESYPNFKPHKPTDMEFNPAKLRSMSTSTPILTRGSLSDNKVYRSMSTSYVNDSGFDESFSECHDDTICLTPSTVCKSGKWTPSANLHDSILDQSYGSCPFSVKSRRFFETPGAHFFSNKSEEQKSERSLRQSISIPSYSLDIDPEPCEIIPSYSLDISPEPCGIIPSNNPDISPETCPMDIELSDRFNEVMQRFSPSEPDRLIGRKMGLDQVDIISELSDRNISCYPILSYLNSSDLCSMCEVSRKWQSVCNGDSRSRKRKNRYSPYKVNLDKENAGKRSPPKSLRGLTESQKTLAPLQLVETPSKEKTPCSIKVDLFEKMASTLKNDEKLRKCPKCSKVSKVLPVQERGQCQNSDCNFDFCIKCFYEFHGSRPCIPVATKKTKTDAIGCKKSKKNLRRL